MYWIAGGCGLCIGLVWCGIMGSWWCGVEVSLSVGWWDVVWVMSCGLRGFHMLGVCGGGGGQCGIGGRGCSCCGVLRERCSRWTGGGYGVLEL